MKSIVEEALSRAEVVTASRERSSSSECDEELERILQELKTDIKVVGYDLIEKNVRYLKSGVIDILISQQSERQGYQALYMLFRHVVLKEKVPGRLWTPLEIITKENVDYRQVI